MALRSILAIVVAACVLVSQAASAQSLTPGAVPPIPDLSSRIPPPAPPATVPPVINGPLPFRQDPAPAPQVFTPPPLTTFSDRVSRCAQQGGAGGLGGGDLQSYVRSCAND